MTTVTRQPRGIRTGGRFAPQIRAEPSLALSPGMTSSVIYRRFTENGMDKAEQRTMSLRLIQGVHDSGLLRKMAGTANVHDVDKVLAAAQDTRRLDTAIESVIAHEHTNPGTTHPDSIGFKLCRNLLEQVRGRA